MTRTRFLFMNRQFQVEFLLLNFDCLSSRRQCKYMTVDMHPLALCKSLKLIKPWRILSQKIFNILIGNAHIHLTVTLYQLTLIFVKVKPQELHPVLFIMLQSCANPAFFSCSMLSWTYSDPDHHLGTMYKDTQDLYRGIFRTKILCILSLYQIFSISRILYLCI